MNTHFDHNCLAKKHFKSLYNYKKFIKENSHSKSA